MSTNTINASETSAKRKYKKRGPIAEIFHRLRKNKGAIVGGIIILILIFLALFCDVIYDFDKDIAGQNLKQRFIKPCWEHPFGTDHLGRDQLARIIYGTRASLPVGFVAVLVALFLGMITGAFAGFFGGKVENVIMRIMDIFAAVPNILMSIALVSAMGTSTLSLMIALGVTSMPAFARITAFSTVMLSGAFAPPQDTMDKASTTINITAMSFFAVFFIFPAPFLIVFRLQNRICCCNYFLHFRHLHLPHRMK